MALPPNGWPDNGPLHSTRERANHSYANGLSRQVQGQPPPPPEQWASLAGFTDATRIHAQKYIRDPIYAITHRDTDKTRLVLRAYIYPLDFRQRGDQEGRARKTISGLRHQWHRWPEQSSTKSRFLTDIQPRGSSSDAALSALRENRFPRKITLVFSIRYLFCLTILTKIN